MADKALAARGPPREDDMVSFLYSAMLSYCMAYKTVSSWVAFGCGFLICMLPFVGDVDNLLNCFLSGGGLMCIGGAGLLKLNDRHPEAKFLNALGVGSLIISLILSF